FEVGQAVSHLVRQGIAVVVRPAFEQVADIDLAPLQLDGGQNPGEELSRLADEGYTLLVFVKAGGFADQNNVGGGISLAKDQVPAPPADGAALAAADPLLQLCQGGEIKVGKGLNRTGRWAFYGLPDARHRIRSAVRTFCSGTCRSGFTASPDQRLLREG